LVKQSPKKKSARPSEKVDFEPNKMGLAVASVAAVSLVLIAIIAMG
jgi:hypothetical protein